jgi:hypothetical protein
MQQKPAWFSVVGLPDMAVQETTAPVRGATTDKGFKMPSCLPFGLTYLPSIPPGRRVRCGTPMSSGTDGARMVVLDCQHVALRRRERILWGDGRL